MAETKPQKIRRLRGERNRRRKLRSNLLNRAEQHAKRIKVINAALKRLLGDDIPGVVDGWHVKAIRNQVQGGIGGFLFVNPKGVLHTTESSSLPNPYRPGSAPHFTLNPKTGVFYQHIPVTSGAMALENDTGGVETNRARAIQIEMIGFSDAALAHQVGKPEYAVANWTDADYARIAPLMRWIEKNCGVNRKCSVRFENRWHGLSNLAWYDYDGWLGHQHIPEQAHWDPDGFLIGKVL